MLNKVSETYHFHSLRLDLSMIGGWRLDLSHYLQLLSCREPGTVERRDKGDLCKSYTLLYDG